MMPKGKKRSGFVVWAAFSVCVFATPAWCQGLAAFGAVPMPETMTQIRSLKNQERANLEQTRTCNKSVPLVGGGDMIDADEGILRKSAANYSTWEREYKSNGRLNFGAPERDQGKRKYMKVRSNGVKAGYIDMFTGAFLVRNLYTAGKNDDVIIEANRLIATYNLKPVFHQIDEAEKDTYLTEEALANTIFFYSKAAKIRANSTNEAKVTALIEYLDIRDELLPTISLFNETDTDDEIVASAGPLVIDAANGLLGDGARNSVTAGWLSPDRDSGRGFVIIQGRRSTTIQLEVGDAGLPPPPPPPHSRRVNGTPDEGPRRRGQERANASGGGDGGFRSLRGEHVLGASVLTAAKAHAAYRQFIEHQLSRYSSKDMVLFDVQRDGDGALITVAEPLSMTPASRGAKPQDRVRTIRLTDAQLNELTSGGIASEESNPLKQLVPQSSKAALVAFSNPFALRGGTYRDTIDAFAFRLQRTEADIRVYRDPLSANTAASVRALSSRLVGNSKDYVAYIDDGSFKVTDFNIVQDIRTTLKTAGIRIVSGVPKHISQGSSKNVIVITAHSDEQLVEFMEALGKAGAFKNNFVILNSCETPITRAIADRVTQQFGARAAFVHQGLIPASSVQDMLVRLSTNIKKQPRASLVDTLRRASQGVGLNGVWSVCENLDRGVKVF